MTPHDPLIHIWSVGLALIGAGLGVNLGMAIMALSGFLVGRSLGLQAQYVLLGRTTYVRQGDSWKKSRAGRPSLRTVVSMMPPSGKWEPRQIRVLNLSISAAMLAACALAFLTFFTVRPPDPLRGLLIGVGFGLLIITFVAVIPYSLNGQPSNMLIAIRASNPAFARKVAADTEIVTMMNKPTTSRNWDRALVDEVYSYRADAAFDLWRTIITYSHYWDSGDRITAFNILRAGEPQALTKQQLPGNLRSFWFEYAYVHAVLPHDHQAAMTGYKRGMAIKGDFAKATEHRALAAIKLIEGDLDAAQAAIDRSEQALLKEYPDTDPRSKSTWVRELKEEVARRREGAPPIAR